jgi:UDP-2,3-diacylglucosamine hydrolase
VLPAVPLGPGTLVVADLHLDVEDLGAVDRFLAFLARARGAPRLVVLGDLFEYWLGRAHQETPGGRRVVAALAERARSGQACDVVPGNRDFLLDAGFERAAGATIRRAGFVGVLPDGARVAFVHGDELATRDRAYQRLRRVIRSRPVAGVVPRLPLAVSRALARRLRRASTAAIAAKPAAEKELQRDAAAALAAELGTAGVVCGHAHDFRLETLPAGGWWLVLDAFGGARDALVVADRAGARSPEAAVAGPARDAALASGHAGASEPASDPAARDPVRDPVREASHGALRMTSSASLG